MGTTIYYLLTAEESRGKIHRNLSQVAYSYSACHDVQGLTIMLDQTMHVLHQGRATYTLVHPPKTPSEGPRVEHITMGTDAAAGEVRQLLVGDSWKMSEIPKEDLAKVAAGEISKDEVGCLITEVVVPGFDWHDHAFLTQGGLEELFKGRENGEKWVKELAPHIRQDN